ncbi:MAG: CdaR family protein [Acidobacteriota bacterium]
MSLRGRLWGLRVLALLMATLLWFFGTLETREQESEKVIEASVTYSTPRGLILLDPVQRVKVRLRGRTSKVRSLNPLAVDVLVSVAESRRGTTEVSLGAENVIVPEDIEVVSIEPNQLELRMDREVVQMLPVKFKLMGEPAAGARVEQVSVFPDRVQVSGPESRLHSIQWLTTSNVNLNGHALDFEESVAVVSPDPLVKVLQPTVVTVRVPMSAPLPTPAAGRTKEVH